MSKIQLRNISKSFEDKKILNNINMVVEEGEMISLLGPSGCGKTTTLKIIAGLIDPSEGDIIFNGQVVNHIPVEKRGAVIVFQDYLLFPHMTIGENIEFGLKMAKVNKKIRTERVKEMINLVKLDGHENKYPRELSGGQKQRVAIARALAIEPKVLLLDEPFSNLDTRLREDMREFVTDIQRKLKITTILVTHDKEEALMTSHRLAVMLNGEIKQYGSPREIYERPNSPVVADFFGEKNYISGSIEKKYLNCELGKFKVNIEDKIKTRVMIRPEEIGLSYPRDDSSLVGSIVSKTYAGEKIYYIIKVEDVYIKAVVNSKQNFNIDDRVSINIDFEKAVYF